MTWPSDNTYGTVEWLIDVMRSLSHCEHMGDVNNIIDALVEQYDLPFVWDDEHSCFRAIGERDGE